MLSGFGISCCAWQLPVVSSALRFSAVLLSVDLRAPRKICKVVVGRCGLTLNAPVVLSGHCGHCGHCGLTLNAPVAGVI